MLYVKNFIILFLVSFLLVACDSNQERAKKSIEDRLEDSFAMSDRQVRQRVDKIVMASKDKDYINAMNELGILSKTNLNNQEQKQAINALMIELRTAMEIQEINKNKGE